MKQFKHLIKPYIIWASILIVVPLILIVLYAFTSDGNEVLTLHFTWANFAKFLEATYLSVILKSFRLGILTTLICLVCGYPLAYIISKYSEKVQSFLILMVTIPMWINMLLRTYAWMNILSDNGLVNNLLKMLGISPITMMYTDFSVIVGLVCNFMPFMIIPIHTSLSKMDKSLSGQRPWCQSLPDLLEDHLEAFHARCGQWYHDGIPSVHINLRYSEASRRRPVHADR